VQEPNTREREGLTDEHGEQVHAQQSQQEDVGGRSPIEATNQGLYVGP
jgi:hypothetical protein